MTTDDVHNVLASAALGSEPTDEDALALMILLHTHRISLHDLALRDRPGVTELEPIAQRHAAEVIATVWPDRTDRRKTDPLHWYMLFNTRTPYEVVEDIPADWARLVETLRGVVGAHGAVRGLEPET